MNNLDSFKKFVNKKELIVVPYFGIFGTMLKREADRLYWEKQIKQGHTTLFMKENKLRFVNPTFILFKNKLSTTQYISLYTVTCKKLKTNPVFTKPSTIFKEFRNLSEPIIYSDLSKYRNRFFLNLTEFNNHKHNLNKFVSILGLGMFFSVYKVFQ